MRRIYSTRTGLEAEQVRLFLESHGIQAHVSGGSNAFEVGFEFTPGSEPGIFVEVADADRALGLLKDYRLQPESAPQRGEWTCPVCGETGEEDFDVCWKCQAPRPADAAISPAARSSDDVGGTVTDQFPAEPSVLSSKPQESEAAGVSAAPSRSNTGLWMEVTFVLIVSQWYFASDWLDSQFEQLWPIGTFVNWSASLVTGELFAAGITLFFIAQSNEKWAEFGLQRPRLLWDLCGASILFMVTLLVVSMSNGLFADALRGWLPPELYHRLIGVPPDRVPLRGGSDLLILLVTFLVVGFSEELIYRGYLIHRLEQLLKSAPLSVLLSAILFAAMHFFGHGILGVWNAFGFGIVFGVVFVHFRRLWPLVFAHALANFVVFAHHSRT